tara:strand:- start:75 stop:884 length:810 start_codon:yes stop_codon:yes gene_type:complete
LKGIHLIKKFIPLLLISVCIGDTLILKDKTVFTGALIKFGNDEIIFRVLPSAKLSVNINDIQELKLSDGTKLFENGIIVKTNEKHIKDKIQDENAKQKNKYKELFIKNTKHNGFRKRNSGTQKSIQNSTLTLKDNSAYIGELVKYGNDEIILKVLLPPGALPSIVSLVSSRPSPVHSISSRMFTAKLSIKISDIQEMKLSDGTKIFENGILMESEEQLRQYIKNEKRNKNAETIIGCCILILILGLYIVLAEIPIISFGSSGGGEFPTP